MSCCEVTNQFGSLPTPQCICIAFTWRPMPTVSNSSAFAGIWFNAMPRIRHIKWASTAWGRNEKFDNLTCHIKISHSRAGMRSYCEPCKPTTHLIIVGHYTIASEFCSAMTRSFCNIQSYHTSIVLPHSVTATMLEFKHMYRECHCVTKIL